MKHLSTATLNAYADDMLSPLERAEVDVHLAVCAHCRATTHALAQMGDVLRGPRAAPPPDLAATIAASLEHHVPAPLPPQSWGERGLTQALGGGGGQRAAWNWTRAALNGLGTAVAWLLLIVLGGETVLAAQRGGLADFATLLRTQPDIVTRYPTEALYALLEAVPVVELSITLVVFVVALWLMQRFVAALPEGVRV